MHDGQNEPVQLRMAHKVSDEVPIPHEPLVRSLVQRHLEKFRHRVVQPLERVGQVVGVGKIETRRSEHLLNHGNIELVLSLLLLIEMQQSPGKGQHLMVTVITQSVSEESLPEIEVITFSVPESHPHARHPGH